ncbi:hypothetical protein D3C85_1787370 [compost metagenome]
MPETFEVVIAARFAGLPVPHTSKSISFVFDACTGDEIEATPVNLYTSDVAAPVSVAKVIG